MKQFHSLKQFKTAKHCATIGETIYHLLKQIFKLLHFCFTQMYHQQQIEWNPRRFLPAHFEATINFSRTEFTCT